MVNFGHALYARYAVAFQQELEDLFRFLNGQVHALRGLLARFLESLAAQTALIPLIALAVSPFALTFGFAIVARHGLNLLAIHSRERDTWVWRLCTASAVRISAPVGASTLAGAFLHDLRIQQHAVKPSRCFF